MYTEETKPMNCYFPLVKRNRKSATIDNFQTTYATSTSGFATTPSTSLLTTRTPTVNSCQDEFNETKVAPTVPPRAEDEVTKGKSKETRYRDLLLLKDTDWVTTMKHDVLEWFEDVYDNPLHYFMRYICIVLSVLAIGHAFYSIWVNDVDGMTNYMVFAAATGGIAYLCLEKSLYFVHWGLSRYFLFPLASLSYNGYLYSLPAAYMYGNYLWST